MAETTIAPTAVATTATTETTTTTPISTDAPKPQEKDQFAEKLELLSRKERAIYRERQKVASERRQIQEMALKVKAWEDSRANAKKNPLDYLSQADLSYDAITQFMLNGGKPAEADKIEALRDEFGQFKKQNEEEKKRQNDSQKQAQAQAQTQVIEEFKEEISEFITQNKSTYELISTRDASEDVFSTIQDAYRLTIQDWRKNGSQGKQPMPMSMKEASDLVEEFYEKEVERLAQTQKMQAKFQATKNPEPGQKKGPAPTLTNQMTTSAAASLLPAKNENERMARALAKLGS